MLVDLLENGWKKYDQSCIWRCEKPSFLVEVAREGNVPSYRNDTRICARIRKVQNFYMGRLTFGRIDSLGTGLDILTANAMAESNGTVPSSLEYGDLKNRLNQSDLPSMIDRLSWLVDYIKQVEPMLVRKEKKLNYSNPLSRPGAISLGAHHMLISTALDLVPLANTTREQRIIDLVLRLSSQSLFSAQLAIAYLNNKYHRHQNEPPLIAAVYNAGSLIRTSGNKWGLRSTNDHIDRWIAYYNTSRLLRNSSFSKMIEPTASILSAESSKKVVELKLVRTEFQELRTIGELYINEQFQCYTLEDTVRSDGLKIKHQTAIPKGRYDVTVRKSSRFKKDLPVVNNVPGFSGILIHPGNTENDTSGCILVGKNKLADRITESKLAFDSLFIKIRAALNEGSCILTIK